MGSASLPQWANAHRPIFTEAKATGSDTAVLIKDPQISQVVYREITKDSSQVWLTFEVPKDFNLFVQIGVPAIDRLKDSNWASDCAPSRWHGNASRTRKLVRGPSRT